MRKPYTVLVCGGRDYADYDRVAAALDEMVALHGVIIVVQGGASGADKLARQWVQATTARHIHYMVNVPADWAKHGKAAGPIRNQHMLDEHDPHIVIAFPGGKGTQDMVRRARAAGVPVIFPEGETRHA